MDHLVFSNDDYEFRVKPESKTLYKVIANGTHYIAESEPKAEDLSANVEVIKFVQDMEYNK